MYIIIILVAAAIVIFALVKGYIGIYGSAVYRDKQPYLYWGQVFTILAGSLVLLTALLRGDL